MPRAKPKRYYLYCYARYNTGHWSFYNSYGTDPVRDLFREQEISEKRRTGLLTLVSVFPVSSAEYRRLRDRL